MMRLFVNKARIVAILLVVLLAVSRAFPEPTEWINKDGQDEHWYDELVITIEGVSDTYVRTDLDVRRNDNYGCDKSIAVGTSRGGGGIPYGEADAMRSLIRFDLTNIYTRLEALCADIVGRIANHKDHFIGHLGKCGRNEIQLESAVLELTLLGAPNTFDQGLPTSVYKIDVHRVLDSGPLTPFVTWVEGNGRETIPYTPEGSGCEHVDPAFGVAWEGADELGDANNQSVPEFDKEVIASAIIDQAVNQGGDIVQWDITQLVVDWLNGTVPNHGILLRDVTSDGSFRGVRFGAREGMLFNIYPDAVQGPRLIVEFSEQPL